MPVNRRWPIAELLRAAREYTESTGRKLTFEYVLLGGVNDSAPDAGRLSRLAAGCPTGSTSSTGIPPPARRSGPAPGPTRFGTSSFGRVTRLRCVTARARM